MENKCLLEIVIPTFYQNSNLIAEQIKYYENINLPKEVVISFHDSSDDDVIFGIISSSRHFLKNIFYYRYASDMSIDKKTIIMLSKANSEYVLLTGDGFFVNIQEALRIIAAYGTNEIIAVYSSSNNHLKHYYNKCLAKKKIDSFDSFVRYNYWFLSFYGGSIIASSLIKRIDLEKIVEKYDHTGFIYPSFLVESKAENCISLLSNNNLLLANKAKKEGNWIKSKNAIKTLTQGYLICINQYNGILSEGTITYIKKHTNRDNALLSFKGLLKYKLNENLSFKILKKYWKEYKQMKGCSYFLTFVALLCPTFLLRVFKKRRN